MKTPIIMAAFGTTSRALDTYSYIDKIIKERFLGHEIIWSYSSRMVKDKLKKEKNIDLKNPRYVFSELHKKGCLWAVAQSMHLIGGHEFYRLVHDAEVSDIRTSVGLPLLSSPEDYHEVVEAMMEDMMEDVMEDVSTDGTEAVILVGHGTDHICWSSYLALSYILREKFGNNIFVGAVEGYPEKENIIKKVKSAGYKKVYLIPFMLVSGVHFEEDLSQVMKIHGKLLLKMRV